MAPRVRRHPVPAVRCRLAAILAERGMTVYQLVRAAGGQLSFSTAYRLTSGDAHGVTFGVLAVLCDVLTLDDPGQLLERDP